ASTPALAAFVDLNGHFGASSLSAIEREVVQLVASTENDCGYCVAGHTAFARDQQMDERLIDALRSNAPLPDPLPDPRLEALARLTRALIQRSGQELEGLVEAGYTQEQALEIIVGICVKTMSNLASNTFSIPVDDAFCSCAWTPSAEREEPRARVA
ncbi:MAG: carboxymuconolactone decarboxylase family protein, partial [Deltaproteobacteria bacterium]|nr:carboxymuconolactone decarboxylase family protein [Deltaproteobacteria bacterium]